MISITLHTATTATVTHQPGLLARLLLDVQRIRDVGGYAWIDGSNRAVSRRIAELIEGAETMRALGDAGGRGTATRSITHASRGRRTQQEITMGDGIESADEVVDYDALAKMWPLGARYGDSCSWWAYVGYTRQQRDGLRALRVKRGPRGKIRLRGGHVRCRSTFSGEIEAV